MKVSKIPLPSLRSAGASVGAPCYGAVDRDRAEARCEVVTVQEAARRLGVHANTIRNWIRSAYLEAHQPAGPRGRITHPELGAALFDN